MSGSGSDLCISSRRRQSLLCQHRIVITMNDVMRYAGVMRLLCKDRLQNFSALSLVVEGAVACRSCDSLQIKRQSVEDRRFCIVRIRSLQTSHSAFIVLHPVVLLDALPFIHRVKGSYVRLFSWCC